MAFASLQECAAAVDHFAPAMLGAAAGSVAILGLASLTTAAMRRASAAARHEVWVLGFAGVLLLPVLSAALPGWHVLPRPGAPARQTPPPAAAPVAVAATASPVSPASPASPASPSPESAPPT